MLLEILWRKSEHTFYVQLRFSENRTVYEEKYTPDITDNNAAPRC
jgi:hypothetical protein